MSYDEPTFKHEPTPGVPPKDAPPGFAIRYDRHSRKWMWKHEASGRRREGFASHRDALSDAYNELRATR